MPFALSPEREKKVDDLLGRYPTRQAAILPVLWLCQQQNGWISPSVLQYVADRLGVTTATVKGVVTFYTMFFDEPMPPNKVWVCRTLSCELRGAKAIQEHLEERFDCHVGGTSKDGKFALMKAECLAACGQAPMVQINDDYYENLTTEELDRIVEEIASKTEDPSAEGAAE
jgi:NADH-quinone oxidoreductase subunit E